MVRIHVHVHAHACALLIDGRPVRDLAHSSCVIVSGFRARAALDLDTYPHSKLIRPRCAERAKPGRGKPVLMAISLVFMPYLSNAVVSAKFPH